MDEKHIDQPDSKLLNVVLVSYINIFKIEYYSII